MTDGPEFVIPSSFPPDRVTPAVRPWPRSWPLLLSLALALLLALTFAFFAWRDHDATNRCHARGGRTWDSGQHCLLPNGTVVNTHDRIWP